MSEQLKLSNIRKDLVRQEETIIYSLTERSQFCRNERIYQAGAFGPALGSECLVDFLLHETERTHSKMRRYTSPDEHSFFNDLPAPILPPLAFAESPLHPTPVNLNAELRQLYERDIVPLICKPGDDSQYGSSSVSDVTCLQALSRRIHFGKFVAESKYRERKAQLDPAIRARDADGIMALITDRDTEAQVLERVASKARTYTMALTLAGAGREIDPEAVTAVYERWVIPMNKRVQVLYLLGRGPQ